MIILILTISVVILGIILCIIGANDWEKENFLTAGVMICVFIGMVLIFEIVDILYKPIDYKNFKIRYDTIKETMTSKDDIRDATFTNNLIEINQKIRTCNEYKDSIWFNIFQNKKICETEIIKKGE